MESTEHIIETIPIRPLIIIKWLILTPDDVSVAGGVAATEHECSLALHINSVSHIMHIIILMALHPSSIYFSQTTDGMGNLSSVQKFRHP